MDKWTDECYQVHYLPALLSYTVDNLNSDFHLWQGLNRFTTCGKSDQGINCPWPWVGFTVTWLA